MALAIPFDLHAELNVRAKAAQVFALLSDVRGAASHFPGVEQLVDLGGGAYRWEMKTMRAAGALPVQAVYACRYVCNAATGSVVWTPVEGIGNTRVAGSWSIQEAQESRDCSHLTLQLQGEMRLPLPGLMKGLVEPVVQGEFKSLVAQHIASLTRRFGGAA